VTRIAVSLQTIAEVMVGSAFVHTMVSLDGFVGGPE
jgi:hypothetical protein